MKVTRKGLYINFVFVMLTQVSVLGQNYMSSEETLTFIKNVYYDKVPQEAVLKSKRANPAIRPVLYQILRDSSQKKIWPQVIASFAYLGQREDVPRLETFIKTRRGILDNYEYSSTMMVFTVFGSMAERGVIEAKKKHLELLQVDYWKNIEFSTENNMTSSKQASIRRLLLGALEGYRYSNDSLYRSYADSVLIRIKRITPKLEDQKMYEKRIIELKSNIF